MKDYTYTYDDFDTNIQADELDINGVYDFVLNEDDNEYYDKARPSIDKYFG